MGNCIATRHTHRPTPPEAPLPAVRIEAAARARRIADQWSVDLTAREEREARAHLTAGLMLVWWHRRHTTLDALRNVAAAEARTIGHLVLRGRGAAAELEELEELCFRQSGYFLTRHLRI